MDPENAGEVAVVPEPEESVMEKVAALTLETPEESAEPEKPPAADMEAEQLAVNGSDTQGSDSPQGKEPLAPPEPEQPSEKASDPAEAESAEQQLVPESEPEPSPVTESVPEPEKLPETEVEPQAVPEMLARVAPAAPEAKPTENGLSSSDEVASSVEEAVASSVEEAVASVEHVCSEKLLENGVSSSDEVASSLEVASSTESPPLVAASSSSTESPLVNGLPESEVSSSNETVPSEQPAEANSEQVSADPPKEEDPDPASGSLSFALLERDQTREALRLSRTLVVLRGLPGSGKTFLARAIADAYKDMCSVVCADDHGIKPESPASSADGYRALDEAVVARCGEGTTSSLLIVVDDTNHTLDRLVRLAELAEQQHLVPVFLEPQTEWSRDPEQLSKRTKRGLEPAKLEAMKAPLLEVSLPLYFGWFLLSSAQDKVKCMALDFVKTLDTLDAFKKHLMDFTGKAEAEVDLEHYFKAKGALHCTTKFCNYGKADGAKEYAQNPAIKDFYGSVSELSLSALFVTPRTVGARVSLTEEQLQLWPADAEKEAESAVPAAASLPPGSRAHVTLGCADGVEPVQTGLDLLEILALQQEGQQGETVEEMELGGLAYYGAGRWLLSLREPIVAPACFSSYYGHKETQAAKPEKKKKPKCAIL
uniref:2',3'-cyclic-nucleotide 3'-phosphodiesterase n=2 Tax=Salarias fasciatus TaxID=181472 RepID=A0A672G6N0_SALFA